MMVVRSREPQQDPELHRRTKYLSSAAEATRLLRSNDYDIRYGTGPSLQ